MFTTEEAAQILTERGYRDRDWGPVRSATVQKWCQRGQLAAMQVGSGRRSRWLIAEEALNSFVPPARDRKGRSDKGRPRKQQEILPS